MQRGDATLRQVVNHLLDLADFFAGDVVVVDARADAHGAVQGMGHALRHVQGEGVFLVAGQARQMALGLYLTMRGRGQSHSADMGCAAAAEHLQVAPLAKNAQMYAQAALLGGESHGCSCALAGRGAALLRALWLFAMCPVKFPACQLRWANPPMNMAELLWYIYDAVYSRKADTMPVASGLTPQRAARTILPILCCMETA